MRIKWLFISFLKPSHDFCFHNMPLEKTLYKYFIKSYLENFFPAGKEVCLKLWTLLEDDIIVFSIEKLIEKSVCIWFTWAAGWWNLFHFWIPRKFRTPLSVFPMSGKSAHNRERLEKTESFHFPYFHFCSIPLCLFFV